MGQCSSFFVHFFVCMYVLNEFVKLISSEEDVINVISYLCSWRRMGAVKFLPAKVVCNGNVPIACSQGAQRDCTW